MLVILFEVTPGALRVSIDWSMPSSSAATEDDMTQICEFNTAYFSSFKRT